ncbi:LysR family transcriptional regulator [Jannaschia sp. Os4]|uniref:hydrogen peroxide-inducible genes activator n=1 Tax=Jannaschia sp. Os4 TaxID=2807617 RepID=UPI001939DC12|nr:hydrogen peroxide-inducible genes activator [Jannaschia sp. Os4]MBM2575470.1 LysR family transcriptional regulator [Jannaschia sp. Os4]
MSEITLRQLRYFEALMAQRHFGRAAAVCAVSQPALSMRIKELEETLGGPLFERGPRAVRPTTLGEAVAARVGPLLRGVEELSDLGRASADRLAGRLALGVIPTIAPYLLPALVAGLRLSHPDLALVVRETRTATLLEEVADGRLDAAILALPVDAPGLVAVPLAEEPFLLVRPAAEADDPVPDPGALSDRLLLLEEGHCFRDQALAICGMRAAPGGLDGASLGTLVQMVGAGLGVTLIPAMAREVEGRWDGLDLAPLPGAPPGRTVGMVWRRTTPLEARLREVAEAVRAALPSAAPPP